MVESYDTYRSYRGKRMTNPIEYNNATGDNANTYETITTFLRQVAATDRYKFYLYKDDIRINLFYADDNKIIELQQKGAIMNNNFWESMTYKQQLKELFTSETDKEKIDELPYTEESLASFINKQNKGRVNFKQLTNNSNGFIIMAAAL